MSKLKRRGRWLVCLLLCGLFCARAAAVEEAIDTEALGSLTVSYAYGTDADAQKNLALSGVLFRLYRVAEVSADGVYTLTPEFENSGVTDSQLNGMNHARSVTEVQELLVSWMGENASGSAAASATETAANALLDGESPQIRVSAYQEAMTDENGTAVFENLQTGLYLLTAEDLTDGEVLYSSSPSLVSIPSVNSEGTGWEYTVSVNAKAEATVTSLEPESDTEPLTENSTEADTEPLTESSTEADTEPLTESSTETETEPPTESSTEGETEPPTETSTEAMSEATTENLTEAGTEPLTENLTEAETEPPTESLTEAGTELPTEISTEAETEPPTEKLTEAGTELPTETATESTTEAQTARQTEAATEPPTNAATDAQTDTASESSSESAPTDAVQTGDTTPLALWLLMMLGASGAFAGCLLHRRNKQMR
ncbi:MAG: hypothetical protein LUI87_04810 [Lachnospiraceae bacterium]|nr:hypothetical protein [Lachnospiraceae bacterium]